MALTVAAAACTGSEENGQSQAVEVVAVWTGNEQANFGLVLEEFKAVNKTDVRYTPLSSDRLGEQIIERLEAGRPPDVAILPQPGLLRDLARTKSLIPIQPFAGPLVDRNYIPLWRELGSFRGTLYGVWFKAAHKSAIWYRPSGFDAAGARTWADFLAAMETLGVAGTPLAIGAASGWPLTDLFENIYLRTAGEANYDALACHEISWEHPTVLHALRTLAQVLGRPEWIAGGTVGALATTFEKSVGQVFGDPPRALLVSGGEFVTPHIPKGKVVGADARAFPFPSIDGSKASVVVGGDVAVLLRDTEEGRDLVRFLATAAAAEPWARAGGFISPNRDLALSVYPDDTTLGLARGLRDAEVVRYDLSDLQPAPFGATADQGMWKLLQAFMDTPSDVDGIAKRLEEAASVANIRC